MIEYREFVRSCQKFLSEEFGFNPWLMDECLFCWDINKVFRKYWQAKWSSRRSVERWIHELIGIGINIAGLRCLYNITYPPRDLIDTAVNSRHIVTYNVFGRARGAGMVGRIDHYSDNTCICYGYDGEESESVHGFANAVQLMLNINKGKMVTLRYDFKADPATLERYG